jgi:transglutaminase-like putative cysteine protease
VPWFTTNTPEYRMSETPGVDQVYTMPLPPSAEASSMVSLEWIHRIVREARQDPRVRETAIRILREARVPERNRMAIITAIHKWVQRHVRYEFDPVGVETFTTPEVMLRQIDQRGYAVEDCDGMVILEHSLLNSVGIDTNSVIVKVDKKDPQQWSHILLEAWDGKKWVSLDPIMKDKPVGWFPPQVFDRRAVPVGNGAQFRSRGENYGMTTQRMGM